jgi:RNA polymerase primary sigma factor
MNINGKEVSQEKFETLTEREQQVIRLRWLEQRERPYRTLEEIAHIMHVSRERIRQIEARALRKLGENEDEQ